MVDPVIQTKQREGVEVRTIARDVGRVEGPTLLSSGALIVTSLSHGCLYRVSATADAPQVYATTGGGANGAAEGPNGMVYVAQLGWKMVADEGPIGRRAATYDPELGGGIQTVSVDGEMEWLTQEPVSPNDLCFGPDGFLYVTDPTRPMSKHDGRIWRCAPDGSEVQQLGHFDWFPNGIGFSHADDLLYVASSDGREILRMPVTTYGLGPPETFVTLAYGVPDGFAFDVDGNMYVAAPNVDGGVGDLQVYDVDGRLMDRLQLGQSAGYTNIALDASGNAYVTDAERECVLMVIGWARPGLPLHPMRGFISD